MDPMDFTMDDPNNVLGGSAHRYQCQQPQAQAQSQSHPPPNGHNFPPQGPSQARESQHYDPVHESPGWYQHNNLNASPRPPYVASQNLPQWSSPAHIAPAATWQQPHIEDMDRARNSEYNSPEYRRAFMPWNEPRRFEGFNHPGYNSNVANGSNNVPTEAATLQSTSAAAGPLRGYGMDPQQYLFQREMYRASMPPQFSALLSESRRARDNPATPSSIDHPVSQQTPSFTGLRAGSRRRLASGWDSEDEEESIAELEREHEVYRRHAAEALFSADYDEERSIAAIRGAVAGGKRVPSKEALASLESVNVKDLTEPDRTCIICYNEFGVSNPEGEIENPIRLPKCKHIFGDKCIKKWFEDSDSCPYCRDKLPSELAVRKNLGAYQSYRLAHREQMRFASLGQRSRYAYMPPGMPSVPAESENARSAAAAQRVQDEYEFMMARQADAWSYSPPSRNAGDSPERRRQARGRHNAIRGPHFLGRPTSVGSARLNPSFNHQGPTRLADHFAQPRRNAASLASGVSTFPSESSGSAGHTPPRGNRLPAGSSIPIEEASPPVAVGSGVPARRQTDQPGLATSRHSLDSNNSDFIFDPPGNGLSRQIPEQPSNREDQGRLQNERSRGIPSFGALLEVSNNATSRFSGDSSNNVDDLVRIPPGWAP